MASQQVEQIYVIKLFTKIELINISTAIITNSIFNYKEN